jgi:transcription initiation factor TFIIB
MHTTVERNLSQAMNELRRLSDQLNVPRNVQETAALLYRKALHRGLVRGRSIAAVTTASLYTACRLSGTPRTLKDVTNASHRKRREIARCYRLILQMTNQTMPIDGPAKYIPKLASSLHLNQAVQTRAVAIVRDAQQQRLTVGKGPVGIAAAAIYLAAHLHGVDLTQRELAAVSQITEVTIRNRYQGLLEGLDHLPNPFREREGT